MVVMCLPSAAPTVMAQERTGSPSICTVHAPQSAMPQPYLVPVRPTCSRIAHSRGVLGSTSNSWDLPLIVRRAIVLPPCHGHVAKRLNQRGHALALQVSILSYRYSLSSPAEPMLKQRK